MLLDGLALLRPRQELCCAVWILFRMLKVFGDWLASWADDALLAGGLPQSTWDSCKLWLGAMCFGHHRIRFLLVQVMTSMVTALCCSCLLLAELLSSSIHESIYSWTCVCLGHWNGFFHHIHLAGLLIVESFMTLYDPLCISTRCKGVWTTFLCRCDLLA